MTRDQTAQTRWWRGLSRYQWFVFAVVSLAWFFDTLDQRVFSLARISAITDLVGLPSTDLAVQAAAKKATAVFLIGWGAGGLVAGALGDRYGRSRLLIWSIFVYSAGSAMTAIASSLDTFVALRFVTGLGIGGVFGLAVTILSDTVSGTARVGMLALLQVLSTVGNMISSGLKMAVDAMARAGAVPAEDVWRILFLVGAAPIVLWLVALIGLRESDAWLRMRDAGDLPRGPFGSYREIFGSPVERRRLLIGSLLSVAGVVGLWGIGEYAVDLQDTVFTLHYRGQGFAEADVRSLVANAKNWAFMLQMGGGSIGMLLFSWAAARFGRRPAFLVGFAAAFVVTLFVYWKLNDPQDAYWMMPLMGATQFGLFAGFSIYLPELFGARVRGTGVSFAYNLGRFMAAAGSFGSALLTTRVFGGYPAPEPLRYSAMAMCFVFLIGLAAAWRAPETRGSEYRD